jgi:hypothetical protein
MRDMPASEETASRPAIDEPAVVLAFSYRRVDNRRELNGRFQ